MCSSFKLCTTFISFCFLWFCARFSLLFLLLKLWKCQNIMKKGWTELYYYKRGKILHSFPLKKNIFYYEKFHSMCFWMEFLMVKLCQRFSILIKFESTICSQKQNNTFFCICWNATGIWCINMLKMYFKTRFPFKCSQKNITGPKF